jgi:hypothetical protein
MNEKRRAGRETDGPLQARFWATVRTLDAVFKKSGLIICLVIATLAVAIAGYAVRNVEQAVDDIAKIQQAQAAEGLERRDQTCLVFERDARVAVEAFRDERRRLNRTLGYIRRIPPSEMDSQLNREIIAGLPQARDEVVKKWREARLTAAPVYCDEHGAEVVGLPEPNLKLPETQPHP